MPKCREITWRVFIHKIRAGASSIQPLRNAAIITFGLSSDGALMVVAAREEGALITDFSEVTNSVRS